MYSFGWILVFRIYGVIKKGLTSILSRVVGRILFERSSSTWWTSRTLAVPCRRSLTMKVVDRLWFNENRKVYFSGRSVREGGTKRKGMTDGVGARSSLVPASVS